MAELELSVLERLCLRQRQADQETMTREVTAGAARRHTATSAIDWHVTTADARIKLRRLYPAFKK